MLLGGVGSELTGGNFWQGVAIGGFVAGFNHAMHMGNRQPSVSDDGDCPTCPKKATDGYIYSKDGIGYQYRDGQWVELGTGAVTYKGKAYFNPTIGEPITGDVPFGPAGAGKGLKVLLSKDAIKSIKSYKELIIEHQSKLTKYILNPDKYDNLGILKNAPNQMIRNKIIQSRVNHLKHEIKTFHKNLNNILNGK